MFPRVCVCACMCMCVCALDWKITQERLKRSEL